MLRAHVIIIIYAFLNLKLCSVYEIDVMCHHGGEFSDESTSSGIKQQTFPLYVYIHKSISSFFFYIHSSHSAFFFCLDVVVRHLARDAYYANSRVGA
jgi:hypothetical protein